MKTNKRTSKGSNDKIPTFETEGLNPNDIKKVVQLRSDLDKMGKLIDVNDRQIYKGKKPDRVCFGCYKGRFCYPIVKLTFDHKMEIQALCQSCIRTTPGIKKDDLIPCLWFCDPEVLLGK